LAAAGLLIGGFILAAPGIGSLRDRIAHAAGGWLAVGVALEGLSAFSYVVIFRAVFCRRMSWRLSYQFGMAEQGANSVLSVSGAGGLALGAWALRRGGMSTEHIGRRTVAFFFLTSLANVGTLVVFAVLYAAGVLRHDPNAVLTYTFGAAAAAATLIVAFGLPRLRGSGPPPTPPSGRLAKGLAFVRNSLGLGVLDAMHMLRRRPAGILAGSVGAMGFDLAVLLVCFKAFGYSPPLGVVVLGYMIGQLGGNIPVPGGIGGLDGGLIGTFALYHQPLAATSAAVLVYHAISLWVPALGGSVAFMQLRGTLRREARPTAMCMPLAEPIQTVQLPATSRAS
jgi:uncharacterized membrane protein YbhN (UPF0104 family)